MDKSGIPHGMIDVLEKISTGVLILNQNGEISYSNDAAIAILNIDLSDLIEKRFLDIFYDQKLLQLACQVYLRTVFFLRIAIKHDQP